MFIRRCGWHRRYFGHAKLLGITSWFSRTMTFSDGMCDRCAVRAREEWSLPPLAADTAEAIRPMPRWATFPFATATVAAAIVVVVAGVVARPLEKARVSRRTSIDFARAPIDTPAPSAAPREAQGSRAASDVRPRDVTPETAEIAGASEPTRVAVRPGARRARIARASDRRAIASPSEPRDQVQVSAAPAEAPHLVAAAAPTMAPSPIDARSLHPFSAPRTVEHQAP